VAGKGDDRRPSAISEQELADRWRKTFKTTARRTRPLPANTGPRQDPAEKARRIGQKELFTQAGPSEVAPK
jgi:hypothetical protein